MFFPPQCVLDSDQEVPSYYEDVLRKSQCLLLKVL